MPITNYDLMIDKPLPAGTLITASGGNIHTRYNGTGGILFFGLGVVTGASFKEVALPSDAADVFEGVLEYTNTYETREGYSRDATTGLDGYPNQREASIIKPGSFAQVTVYVDSAIALNDPVFLRYTATPGVTGLAGCFRNDADTATALEIPAARFIEGVAAPAAGEMAIAVIEFN